MTIHPADVTAKQREANKRLVVAHHRAASPAPLPEPIFVIAEGEVVVQCLYQPQPEPDDPTTLFTYFAFDVYRVVDGAIVEHHSNRNGNAAYVVPPLDATTDEPRVAVGGPSTPEQLAANKHLTVELFRVVLESHDAEAAKHYVTEDYRQHAAHLRTGRAGLEEFVRRIFPDGPIPTPAELPNPPRFLVAEGDLTVIAGTIPQPDPADPSRTVEFWGFDAFRVQDGLLAEHWTGMNKNALPQHKAD